MILLGALSYFVGGPKSGPSAGERAASAEGDFQPPRTPETPSEEATGSFAPRPDALAPIAAYFSIGGERHGHARGTIEDSLRDLDVQFLLATVPDPIDSRFGYKFDAAVDAIAMAVESQGFVLDHFWLPWWPSGRQPATSDLSRAWPATGTGTAQARLHEREPGMLVFRDREPRPRAGLPLLVVLLVGESPTLGIHKAAFARSIELIERHGMARSPQQPIRIIGPYFSGSAHSMALALSEWAALRWDRPQFVLYTGSATTVDQKQFRKAADPAKISLRATVIPDELVVPWLLDYLRRIGGGNWPDRVAILTESDTSYGALVQEAKGRIPNIVNMKFPLRMSHLRSALMRGRTDGERGVPALPRPRTNLRVPLDEVGSPLDVVPALSPAMTAATDEFLLAKILSAISHEDFRYVGIFGTDVRDTLFLAELISEFCPDTQLFTNTCDVLLAHPDYSGRLRGMIVASSYPLNSSTQAWTFPFNGVRERRHFHQQADQGIYNATLLHFIDTRGLHGPTGGHDAWRALFDYGAPSTAVTAPGAGNAGQSVAGEQRPPLWIGVVGQRGIWPVEYVVPRSSADTKLYETYVAPVRLKTAAEPLDPHSGLFPFIPRYTWTWGTALMINSAVIWAMLWARWRLLDERRLGSRGRPVPERSERGFRMLVELMRPVRTPGMLQDGYLALAWMAVSALYWFIARTSLTPFFFSAWSFGLWPGWSSSWNAILNWFFVPSAVLVTCLTVVALVLIVWARLMLHVAERATDDAHLRSWIGWTLRMTVFLASAILVLGLLLYAQKNAGDSGLAAQEKVRLLLKFERSVQLSNGVSPTMPALWLGVLSLCWFFFQLKRIYLVDRLETDGPFGPAAGQATAIWEGVGEATSVLTQIRRRAGMIGDLCRGWHAVRGYYPGFCAFFGLAIFAVLRLFQKFIPSVDQPVYSKIMLLFFVLFALAVVFAFARFVLIWRRLGQLFREVARLPLLQAYDRLPMSVSRGYGRYLDDYEPRLSNLTLAVHQWARLANAFDDARGAIRTRLFGDTGRQLTATERAVLEQIEANIKLSPDATGPEAAWFVKALFETEIALTGDFGDLARGPTRTALARSAATCLRILIPYWSLTPLRQGYADAPVDATAETIAAPRAAEAAPGGPSAHWFKDAEELVALETVNYISQFTIHLRNLAGFLTVGPLLLLLTVTSYPFEPARLLMVLVGGIAMVVVFFTIAIYVQMDRNEFLSRVSRTAPNRVTFDRTFLATVLPAILPLVGVALTQFPDLSDAVDNILDPMLRMLR